MFERLKLFYPKLAYKIIKIIIKNTVKIIKNPSYFATKT